MISSLTLSLRVSRDHIKEKNREHAKQVFGHFIHDPYHASKAKYGREKWKYQELMQTLWKTDLLYEFEFPLLTAKGYVRLYDLCLRSLGLLIEFDGKYHNRSLYSYRDDEKDVLAEHYGWTLIRIPVLENSVIPSSCLFGII